MTDEEYQEIVRRSNEVHRKTLSMKHYIPVPLWWEKDCDHAWYPLYDEERGMVIMNICANCGKLHKPDSKSDQPSDGCS